ncbi:MAG: histidine kinase dimerization/phosphoacceptor domain -containing protein, partial [Spirochaetaceae bacterium]|nr:histidine kinase dimerization/phosphoacceptor domain -containing protein [Spirochaetaceae bacterium]
MIVNQGGRTVLLVEDDLLQALAKKAHLENAGYRVVAAACGEEAIEAAGVEDSAVEIVLMDIRLGGRMDGIQAAEAILKRREVPIVFNSWYMEEETARRAIAVDSYGYIAKASGYAALDVSLSAALRLFDARTARGQPIEGEAKAKKSLSVRRGNPPSANKSIASAPGSWDREEMAAVRAVYPEFFEMSPAGCFVLSPDGSIQMHNIAASKVLGMSNTELVGRRLRTLVAESDVPVFNAFWGNVVHGKAKDKCDVALAQGAEGNRVVHLEASYPENARYCACLVFDATARAQYDERMRDLLRGKELLLAEVHHRIKNNMSSLSALLSLQSQSANDPTAKGILSDAVRRVESMCILYDMLYRSN